MPYVTVGQENLQTSISHEDLGKVNRLQFMDFPQRSFLGKAGFSAAGRYRVSSRSPRIWVPNPQSAMTTIPLQPI